MSTWNNAWQQTPWLGAAPTGPQTPTAPHDPTMPGWAKESYGMGEGRYASPINEPNKAPTTATGQVQARELAGMFGTVGKTALGKTALGTGAAIAAGFAPSFGDVIGNLAGNLANPGTMAGLAGNVAAKAAGFTPPTGMVGRVAKAINPALTMGLGLMSPALGLGYAALSPFAMDAMGDMTNTRKDEKFKDAMEDDHGFFGGRAASRDFGSMAQVGGFGSLESMGAAHGYGPADMARGMSNKDATAAMNGRNPMGTSYGGWGGIGGPDGGARAVDSAYGRNMGGFAGLGIGNPSSHGGSNGGRSGGGPGRGGRGDSTGTGGGYSDGKGGVSGL